ncbi:hypothetical protein GCM10023405_43310 [Streptomonospora salina]
MDGYSVRMGEASFVADVAASILEPGASAAEPFPAASGRAAVRRNRPQSRDRANPHRRRPRFPPGHGSTSAARYAGAAGLGGARSGRHRSGAAPAALRK